MEAGTVGVQLLGSVFGLKSDRFGGPPDYTIANLYYLKVQTDFFLKTFSLYSASCHIVSPGVASFFLELEVTGCHGCVDFQGKTKNHPVGSLEMIVENLVKTWEMERSHKLDPNKHRSVDPKTSAAQDFPKPAAKWSVTSSHEVSHQCQRWQEVQQRRSQQGRRDVC